MAPGQCMSHSPWHLALRNFIMQIKNKLNNLIVSTFLLLFVNKIMFTKCFFLLQKGFLFVKWVLFLLKMCFFFLGRVLFLYEQISGYSHDSEIIPRRCHPLVIVLDIFIRWGHCLFYCTLYLYLVIQQIPMKITLFS